MGTNATAWQRKREENIARNLKRRLNHFTEGDRAGFLAAAEAEREDLSREHMGKLMLKAIGQSYVKTASTIRAKIDGSMPGILRGSWQAWNQKGRIARLEASAISQCSKVVSNMVKSAALSQKSQSLKLTEAR